MVVPLNFNLPLLLTTPWAGRVEILTFIAHGLERNNTVYRHVNTPPETTELTLENN